jgi:hypothetical protein
MNKSAVVQLISHKAWIYSGVSFAVLAGLMGYVFIKYQLFEAFYDLTRDHEDWQMDHVFMVLLACLMAFSMVLFVLTIHFGRHLLETSNKLIEAERQISRGRQLVCPGNHAGRSGALHQQPPDAHCRACAVAQI